MRHSGWNDNKVPGMHFDVLAVFAADAQGRRAAINSKNLVSGAVIMRERINAVAPRVAPVVLSKTLFKHRGPIPWLCCEHLPIQ